MMSATPLIREWTEPPTQVTGCSVPTLLPFETDLYLAYHARNPDFPGYSSGASPDHPGFEGRVVVVCFKCAIIHRFGYPNSEALNGHPLYKYGLQIYAFQTIENSPWIAELSHQNEVHPHHHPSHWEGLTHWVVTFEDDTLEVIGRSATVAGVFGSISTTEALQKIISLRDEDRERRVDREFYSSLGPEDSSRPCKQEGCQRGSIQYSVMCKRHHFEMIRHYDCPFDD